VFAPLNIVPSFRRRQHAGRSGAPRPRPDRHGLSHRGHRSVTPRRATRGGLLSNILGE